MSFNPLFASDTRKDLEIQYFYFCSIFWNGEGEFVPYTKINEVSIIKQDTKESLRDRYKVT
ncbi:hypothetical protein ALT1545_350016 [Alteromonas macleodii]